MSALGHYQEQRERAHRLGAVHMERVLVPVPQRLSLPDEHSIRIPWSAVLSFAVGFALAMLAKGGM